VEQKSHAVTPRLVLESNVRFRGLGSVEPHKPEVSQRNTPSGAPIFSPAEMRHNFAIWAWEKDATSERRRHLYYCLRCKWSFSVDDRRGSVTPLDLDGNPIQGAEVVERLATFDLGLECPGNFVPVEELVKAGTGGTWEWRSGGTRQRRL
jgi:hypothetical protein